VLLVKVFDIAGDYKHSEESNNYIYAIGAILPQSITTKRLESKTRDRDEDGDDYMGASN